MDKSIWVARHGQLVAAVVDIVVGAESAAVQHGFDALRRHFFLGADHQGPRPGLDVSTQHVVHDAHFVGVIDDGGAGQQDDFGVDGAHQILVDEHTNGFGGRGFFGGGRRFLGSRGPPFRQFVDDSADQIVGFIDDDDSVVKRVDRASAGHDIHFCPRQAIVMNVGIFGADHGIELGVDLLLGFRRQFAEIATGYVWGRHCPHKIGGFGRIHHPDSPLFVDEIHGQLQQGMKRLAVIGFALDGNEFPILIFFIQFVATLLQLFPEICFERSRGHHNDPFLGFESLGNGDGRARFAGSETVVEEQSTVRGIQIEVIAHHFLMNHHFSTTATRRFAAGHVFLRFLTRFFAIGSHQSIHLLDELFAVI